MDEEVEPVRGFRAETITYAVPVVAPDLVDWVHELPKSVNSLR